MHQELFDASIVKKGASVFNALDHSLRINMLLFMQGKGMASVTEIHTAFQIDQSVASHQLRILRNAGLVSTKREGKHIYYSVNHKRLERIAQLTNHFLLSGVEGYTHRFENYAQEISKQIVPPYIISFKDMPRWVARFTKDLENFQAALSLKAAEFLKEARNDKRLDQIKLKESLLMVSKEALYAFTKKYRT